MTEIFLPFQQKIHYHHIFFQCSISKSFISISYVCDNHSDCSSAEDEENCNISFDEMFFCEEGGEYINFKQVCDHVKDCENGKDESFCGKYIVFIKNM